jgi:hypothetical protein
MPIFRGVEVSVVDSQDAVKLPEYPHPEGSSVCLRSPNNFHHAAKVATDLGDTSMLSVADSISRRKWDPRISVYIPSAAGRLNASWSATGSLTLFRKTIPALYQHSANHVSVLSHVLQDVHQRNTYHVLGQSYIHQGRASSSGIECKEQSLQQHLQLSSRNRTQFVPLYARCLSGAE